MDGRDLLPLWAVTMLIAIAALTLGIVSLAGDGGSSGGGSFPGAGGAVGTVARAHGDARVTVPGPGAPPVDYHLADNTWTQAADEADQLVVQVRFDPPAGEQLPAVPPGCPSKLIQLQVDDEPIGGIGIPQGDEPRVTPFKGNAYAVALPELLPEPGSETKRSLTARLETLVPPGSPPPGATPPSCPNRNVAVTSLKVNVIAFR